MNKFNFILLIILVAFFQQPDTYSIEELIGKSSMTNYDNIYNLRSEVYNAFLKMQSDALNEGIHIEVVSSYRSFEHQKRIWTRKYNKYISQGLLPEKAIDKIIEYSTIPGTSRHHWGTDIDIIDGSKPKPKDVLLAKHFEKGGLYNDLKKWLDNHAEEYGFCLVYTDVLERKGFKYEPWHFSYLNTSKEILLEFIKIDIKKVLLNEKIVGSEYFTDDFLHSYIEENVLDINPNLK